MPEIKKDGMSRPPVRNNPADYPEPKRFPYTNIDDCIDDHETKADPALDQSITVRQACLIALEQCKSIFEPNGVLWNQAIDAVVNALRNHAHNEQP